ncbi:MAG: amidohydrolase [Eubacteriales bacterium]|nr:amidohydrolase [Eubacteriales bacterium]
MTYYFNGTIVPMLRDGEKSDALLTQNGSIAALGERARELADGERDIRRVDLKGRTLLPAFLDSHSHITALAGTLDLADLSACGSFEELVKRLRTRAAQLRPGQWLLGFGYDHNDMQEKRHPDKNVLDTVSAEIPILITHASGHMGVANTAALKMMGLNRDTPDEPGGKKGRDASGELNGYLEERVFMAAAARAPRPTVTQQTENLLRAQEIYLSHGIATIQDGKTGAAQWRQLCSVAQRQAWKADVVAYLDMEAADAILGGEKNGLEAKNGLTVGGYKVFLDGSPQGKTAWLSQPYATGGNGYPVHTDAQVLGFAQKAIRDGRQLLAHCNGDAAAQQWIDAYGAAMRQEGHGSELRPVMIHAQTLRPDQMPAMTQEGMIASFFAAHLYYWGDVHLENLGEARARRISPLRSALEQGVVSTLHTDTPVLPPNLLASVGCAVNRVTGRGIVLGEEERIPAFEALRMITFNAAWQYHQEKRKGTLEPGKAADLVVLDADPLACKPEDIQKISVEMTIKGDEIIWEKR